MAGRVCYLVQSHTDAEAIVRLARTLRRSSAAASILVVHDDTGCRVDPARLRREAGAEFLPVHGPIRRGYFSMLLPYFEGVAWLARNDLDFDWLVYLSAQDYPVQPIEVSERALRAADCDGFLEFRPARDVSASGRRRQGRLRYDYRYVDAPRWTLPALRLLRALNGIQSRVHLHLVYGPRVGFRRARTPFESGRSCYVGSQWTTLRRVCVELVAEVAEHDRELVDHFRETVVPDESFVQTVLVGAGRFRLVDDNLRFADHRGSRTGSPRWLEAGDLPVITSGRYHFARKFGPAQAPLLDRLDREVLHLPAA